MGVMKMNTIEELVREYDETWAPRPGAVGRTLEIMETGKPKRSAYDLLDRLVAVVRGGVMTVSNMTEEETYQGWANRETWAFNLHWQNDRGLYEATLEVARGHQNAGEDFLLGQAVVLYWDTVVHEWEDEFGEKPNTAIAAFRDEVGSWWRVNYAEVGAAVRESLDNES